MLFSDVVYRWLEAAMDFGICEADFWSMTITELTRAVESKKRIEKQKAQEKATFDYILADLVGRSIARVYSSNAKMPELCELYPSLFESQKIEEKKQEKRNEISAFRFKMFAKSFNERRKQGGAN